MIITYNWYTFLNMVTLTITIKHNDHRLNNKNKLQKLYITYKNGTHIIMWVPNLIV